MHFGKWQKSQCCPWCFLLVCLASSYWNKMNHSAVYKQQLSYVGCCTVNPLARRWRPKPKQNDKLNTKLKRTVRTANAHISINRFIYYTQREIQKWQCVVHDIYKIWWAFIRSFTIWISLSIEQAFGWQSFYKIFWNRWKLWRITILWWRGCEITSSVNDACRNKCSMVSVGRLHVSVSLSLCVCENEHGLPVNFLLFFFFVMLP